MKSWQNWLRERVGDKGKLASCLPSGRSAHATRLSSFRAPAGHSLDARLQRLYIELQEELLAMTLPTSGSHHTLTTYIDHLLGSLSSLSQTILTQRASLLTLLTSPSLSASPLPRTPSLAITASSLRHASTTLSAARAKHLLLLGHAQASLVVPPIGDFAAQSLKLYDEELRKRKKEVALLQAELDGYEKQMKLLEGGGGRKFEGGYRILLGEWEELLREEKEVRGDLRRLGWVGES